MTEWKRDETIGTARMILGDCMDLMAGMGDRVFDFCIADPWYGVGMTENDTTGFAKRRYRGQMIKGQDSPPSKEHFYEMRRISKNQIIWGGNYFLDYLGNCRAPIIWDKGTGANYFADGEMAWTSFKTGCLRIVKHQWCGAFKDSERGDKLIHPCQKPVYIYKWLLERYAQKGFRIFSPYGGSGSDAIACIDLGYQITWIEKDEDYYDAAVRRVKEFASQPRLIDVPAATYKDASLFERP